MMPGMPERRTHDYLRHGITLTTNVRRSGELAWRNASARHPGVLAAQRRERARSQRQHHWGRPEPKAA